MNDVAIQVRGLGKKYRIGHQVRSNNIREAFTNALSAPFRRMRQPLNPDGEETFWALKDVSFDVKRGEVVGVIGRNGAGKSTLLKILSRITDPTEGEAIINGRVGSLLEVGTGFHSELTGRENIYLNGAILGMKRGEIDKKFDEIVAFSEVEKFLDTPVKHYSSGMYMRLAFAVAAHLEPEILIVDEVLAVGDSQFQKKCLGKMQDVAGQGRTVVFVSHNMDAVLSLCSRAVFMDRGSTDGPTAVPEAVHRYLDGGGGGGAVPPLRDRPREFTKHGQPVCTELHVESAHGNGDSFPSGDAVTFRVRMENIEPYSNVACAITIVNEKGQRILVFHSLYHSGVMFNGAAVPMARCTIDSLPLTPGDYRLQLTVSANDTDLLERVDDAGRINVYFADLFGTGRTPNYNQGNVALPAHWSAEPQAPHRPGELGRA